MEYSLESSTFLFLLALLAGMAVILFVGWITTSAKPKMGLEPYSKTPLRPFTDLKYPMIARVQAYLEETEGFENRSLDIFKASFCRETGRIYPNSVSFFGNIQVDWDFISKKYPGHYVSWGSLDEAQQREVKEVHPSLTGFQTEASSPNPSPKNVLPEYYLKKPGPLYVNMETKDLLGWKVVPDTEFEVLILQKPKKREVYDS